MMLSPLIVAVCLTSGPTYDVACRTSLEQAAAQTGFASQIEELKNKTEHRVIRYINPSKEVEVFVGGLGYAVQLISRRQATIALPTGFKNSSFSMSVGSTSTSIGLNIGF